MSYIRKYNDGTSLIHSFPDIDYPWTYKHADGYAVIITPSHAADLMVRKREQGISYRAFNNGYITGEVSYGSRD